MRAYLIRRLLLTVPVVVLASIIVFFTIRMLPGSVVDLMVSKMEIYTDMDVEAIKEQLGLDVPVYTQYGRWVGVLPQADGNFAGLLQADFGKSLWKQTPVIDEIKARWPVTLELGFLGIIVAQLIALPIGIYSAVRQDSWGDYAGRSFAILCIAVPSFWIATMVIVFPSLWWGYMPPILYIPLTEDPLGNLGMLVVPAIILGMSMGGTTMRMTRTMMLEVLRQDYIRTAWAKGLKEKVIVVRHALRNALIPVITLIGYQVPVVVGGTVIIEQIFSLPGLGRLILDASLERDYTIVSGVMLFFAIVMVLVNLIVDLSYSYVDPKIRYS